MRFMHILRYTQTVIMTVTNGQSSIVQSWFNLWKAKNKHYSYYLSPLIKYRTNYCWFPRFKIPNKKTLSEFPIMMPRIHEKAIKTATSLGNWKDNIVQNQAGNQLNFLQPMDNQIAPYYNLHMIKIWHTYIVDTITKGIN